MSMFEFGNGNGWLPMWFLLSSEERERRRQGNQAVDDRRTWKARLCRIAGVRREVQRFKKHNKSLVDQIDDMNRGQ